LTRGGLPQQKTCDFDIAQIAAAPRVAILLSGLA